VAAITQLLDDGVDLEATDCARTTPLCAAAAGGHMEALRLLLARGAKADGESGAKPLCAAVGGERHDAVQALLERGARAGIELLGLTAGETHAEKMCSYELLPRKAVAGHAVWQAVGDLDCFIFYAPSYKQWFVSDRADMEAGATNGWLYVASTALAPHLATGTWRVAKGAAKESQAANYADQEVVGCVAATK
jgi:ankyrin repeat protein